MSKLNDLANLLRTKVFNEIEEYWEEAETYAEINLSPDTSTVKYVTELEKVGNRGKIKANNARGIYMWTIGDKILYVGKTDSPTMSIHKRQKNHIRSFEKPWEQHESSGRKYREFMKENNLQNMQVVIKYINTLDYDIEGMAELLETATINHYQPMLNREIKGRGSRNAINH